MTPRRLAVVATPGLDVHVYFGSDHNLRGCMDPGFGMEFKTDVPLLDGYPRTFLSTGHKVADADSYFSGRDAVDGSCQAISGA